MFSDRRRLAIFAAGFCAFLLFYAPQAVLPQLAGEMGISPAAAGLMVGVTTLGVALSAPFVGLLSDRVGRKVTIVGAALAVSVPTLLLICAQDFHQMLFWRFAQGVCLPAIFSATVAYVNEEWPPDEAADLTGVYVGASALGGFCGRFVTAMMTERFGWKSGFEVLTVLVLICALIIWKWLPRERRRIATPQGAGKDRAKPGLAGFEAMLAHLRNPVLLATFAVGFAVLFSLVATFTYVNFLLARPPFGFGPAQLGMIFLVYPIGAAAAPLTGTLIRHVGRRTAMVVSVILCVAGMMLTLLPQIAFIVVGLIFFISGAFFAQSSATGFTAQAARYAKSTAVGLYVCFYYVGGSLGSVVPGLVWGHAGWPGCVFLVAAVLIGAATLAWRAWRTEPAMPPRKEDGRKRALRGTAGRAISDGGRPGLG